MREYQLEILLSLFICFVILLHIKNSKEIKVFDAVIDASIEFSRWREDNPHIYLGLSDEGKRLLTRLIICHDDFHALFTFVDGSDHRAYLMSLFDELPPLPHKPTPNSKTKPSFVKVFSF